MCYKINESKENRNEITENEIERFDGHMRMINFWFFFR